MSGAQSMSGEGIERFMQSLETGSHRHTSGLPPQFPCPVPGCVL